MPGNQKYTIHALHPRGDHWPPDCAACSGFGYVRLLDNSTGYPKPWRECKACLDHPGHSMTHLDWAILRERE